MTEPERLVKDLQEAAIRVDVYAGAANALAAAAGSVLGRVTDTCPNCSCPNCTHQHGSEQLHALYTNLQDYLEARNAS